MAIQSDWVKGSKAIYRGQGVTPSEKYLKALCEHSFLSLWSYPGVYGAPGKELCDVLVVFENHILIFSDKHHKFPDTGNLQVDWKRWYRETIANSAKQIYGAERRILSDPNHLYLDAACKQPLPIGLPTAKDAVIHRIIVAHGASERCKREYGGSGSLMIQSNLFGKQHYEDLNGKTAKPFVVGQIEPDKGYIHVFDDTTLDIVLNTLDTITDFVEYLAKKEQFLQKKGRIVFAPGEEELLAIYLSDVDENDAHDFIFPKGHDLIVIEEGEWEHYCQNPQRKAQLEHNEISYVWDALIESFNKHLLNDTKYFTSHGEVKDIEKAHRFLAREPRTVRRLLAKSLVELVENKSKLVRAVRVMVPPKDGDPYYVILILQEPAHKSYEEYREFRRKYLEAYCHVVKVKFPDAKDIVGIATEPGIDTDFRSEDLIYMDVREWSEDQQNEAVSIQAEFNMLQTVKISRGIEYDYPPISLSDLRSKLSKNPRNEPCPCGSGKKYKHCCYRRPL